MTPIRSAFIRHYRAPTQLVDGHHGTWYAEYDGVWTVREFVVRTDLRTAAAPFELTMRGPDHPTEPPEVPDIAPIMFREFESLWEQFAQVRLHERAVADADHETGLAIHYFRTPFPAAPKRDEAASTIYDEFAQGVARRSFETFAHRTLVAPYDVGVPEGDVEDMLRAAREGLGSDGAAIDPQVRPVEISHAVFEAQWELHALAHLRVLAGLP